jgi:hypothetical protein
MPRGETFWNPYRWVRVGGQKARLEEPCYQHRFEGLAGRLWCELKALTPLLIGDGTGHFTHKEGKPYIPGTSLKGVIRSLAELVSDSSPPFEAQPGGPASWKLDPAARIFGSMGKGKEDRRVLAGLVRFGDAEMIHTPQPPKEWRSYTVIVGQPKRTHRPFYPEEGTARKVYHHAAGRTELLGPGMIKQTVPVWPAPPGTTFAFPVAFHNLRDEELNLLLYCLALEENVTVELSKEALGPDATGPRKLSGPLRHKLGSCKPLWGGSAHIELKQMTLWENLADRYRGKAAATALEGPALHELISARTRAVVDRQDDTMKDLRAMLIYSEDDPRASQMRYPSYPWFQDDKQQRLARPLKPTR